MGLNDSVGLPTGRSFGHSMGVCGIRLAVAADAGHKVFFAWVVFRWIEDELDEDMACKPYGATCWLFMDQLEQIIANVSSNRS